MSDDAIEHILSFLEEENAIPPRMTKKEAAHQIRNLNNEAKIEVYEALINEDIIRPEYIQSAKKRINMLRAEQRKLNQEEKGE